MQARVKNAREPQWEARFEPRSYGFRPGRRAHDAIEAIFTLATPQGRRKWIVETDIKSAFDNLSSPSTKFLCIPPDFRVECRDAETACDAHRRRS
jgi:hypothetical protein